MGKSVSMADAKGCTRSGQVGSSNHSMEPHLLQNRRLALLTYIQKHPNNNMAIVKAIVDPFVSKNKLCKALTNRKRFRGTTSFVWQTLELTCIHWCEITKKNKMHPLHLIEKKKKTIKKVTKSNLGRVVLRIFDSGLISADVLLTSYREGVSIACKINAIATTTCGFPAYATITKLQIPQQTNILTIEMYNNKATNTTTKKLFSYSNCKT